MVYLGKGLKSISTANITVDSNQDLTVARGYPGSNQSQF